MLRLERATMPDRLDSADVGFALTILSDSNEIRHKAAQKLLGATAKSRVRLLPHRARTF
jgi:hypothetical protein